MMTYLKSKEVESERVNESVHIVYVDDDTLLYPNETRSRDRARSREAYEGERLQDRNMYKSLHSREKNDG